MTSVSAGLQGPSPSLHACLLAAVLGAWMPLAGHAAEPAARLHTVLAGQVKPGPVSEGVTALRTMCLLGKGLPEAPPVRVSAQWLVQYPAQWQRTDIDGERIARYEMRQVYAVDENNCAPVVIRHLSVEVLDGCSQRLFGAADGEDPAKGSPLSSGPGRCKTQRPRTPLPDLSRLPREDAGLGTQCLWWNDVMALSSPALGAAVGDRRGIDVCVYSRQPRLELPGLGPQLVVLKHRLATTAVAGNDLTEMPFAPSPTDLHLVEFSDGAPLPANTFTRAGAEAFLRQPLRIAIPTGH
ncbi:hypothetical protein KAK06_08610 [Ideonella sp. 4Y11]|uniref:Uncharacterized protein n=1 Tax=Ideonella aquatica TaxID=2824119 RepID=A0A940YTF2_9BURK|nr:hypothetical protein [Ideonella aquatica]MBQ0959020.1 hypothetical protein [Ideonella aquatica]